MAKKVNIVLEDDVKADLDNLVEAGSRSRIINIALRKELTLIRRRQLTQQLNKIRAKTKPMSSGQIVQLLRRDRGR
jgi:hypothetical protein